MFSNFHQKNRITIFLFLSLYVAGGRRVRGELSQNQNNSIDRVARITRGATISARWGAKTSRAIRESIVAGIIVFYFSYRKSAWSILLVLCYSGITIPTTSCVNFTEIFQVPFKHVRKKNTGIAGQYFSRGASSYLFIWANFLGVDAPIRLSCYALGQIGAVAWKK